VSTRLLLGATDPRGRSPTRRRRSAGGAVRLGGGSEPVGDRRRGCQWLGVLANS